MRRSYALLALVLVVPCSAAPAAGAQAADTAGKEKQATQVDFAGMKVSIDPQTGRLQPLSQEEAQRLGAAMRQKLQEIRARAVERHAAQPSAAAAAAPEGVRSAVVGATHLRLSVLSLGSDGKRELSCLSGSEISATAAPARAPSKDKE